MRLSTLFEQRKIGATYSSIRSRKQLSFPSGPQFTESAQESAVVDQLAFSPFVHDLVTQVTIHFECEGKKRQYTSDVLVEYRAPDHETAERFMIEAKRQQDIDDNAAEHAARFAAARAWCEAHRVSFCLLNETDIKTTYLANVRLLAEAKSSPLDPRSRTLVQEIIRAKPGTVDDTIQALEAKRMAASEARIAVEKAVVDRVVACDLTKPFCDATRITSADRRRVRSANADPFLATLRAAARRAR